LKNILAWGMRLAIASLASYMACSVTPEHPIRILRPAGGETFVVGDTVAVAWSLDTKLVQSVRVLASTDNGAHESNVFDGPFTGVDTCLWVIGSESDAAGLWYPSDSVAVILEDSQGKYADETAAPLHVRALKLLAPAAWDTVHVGDTVSIKWRGSSRFISSVLVYIATGKGTGHGLVASNSFGLNDSCRWIVGSESERSKLVYPSDSVRVLIYDYDKIYSDTTAGRIHVLERN
jgi:hypothetical protein